MADQASILKDIFNAALRAVDPYFALLKVASIERNCLHVGSEIYDLKTYKRIAVIGAGKATARMALAIENLLGDRISSGLVIVKTGHSIPLNIIRLIEAAHPVPDQAGISGTQEIINMARLANEETLLICLLSGGASALLVAPADSVSLADKQEATSMLLKAGATITELNTVRKHLSAIKGGKLAQAAYPSTMVTFILSDAIGDQLDVIASGPTVPDKSSFADAWNVIQKYQLQNKVSGQVREHLQQEMEVQLSASYGQKKVGFSGAQNIIIGSNRLALDAAREKSQQLGIRTEIIKTDLQGEARDAARYLAQIARTRLQTMLPDEIVCLLSGGETTVTVCGTGTGGRNQELALAFALEVEGIKGVSLLSAGTDGGDGSGDAAGAIVSGDTSKLARQCAIEPRLYLDNNDSYHFFKNLDECQPEKHQLSTGQTGTNVMDVQIMLLEKSGG